MILRSLLIAHLCDMTHLYGLFICVIWLIAKHSRTYATWLIYMCFIHMCDMTHREIHMCDMTSYNCRSFSAKEPLIIGLFCGSHITHMNNTRAPMWHNSFMWVIHMCVMTHREIFAHLCDMTHLYVAFICVIWLIAKHSRTYVMWLIYMCTHINESHHIGARNFCDESYHTYEWVITYIWMSHVPHINESCPTHQ